MNVIAREVLGSFEGTDIIKLVVSAPHIAKKAMPGQFVVLMVNEHGERIPLTIVDTDKAKGTVTIIFQVLGLTTGLLKGIKAGDSLYALVGPLGHATHITNYGKVILVGGGVGIAEIYPVAKALKNAGNNVTVIIGSRTKELLILEKELKAEADNFYVTTDNGSYGRKAFTTDVLKELLSAGPYQLVYSVGPIPMMKRSAEVTKPFNVHTIVSLNAIMVDGTGMCGCCRVAVGGEVKFSCVDGPEFDAHKVDWDELIKRNRVYTDKEKHICNLSKII
ncbi:MAG: sulfide/dihydroorotate dehydrogenase-like FAD/NAD-binding protein [Candidatus Omnitrophica bacterium]|nr:sulfide/dihydroorotate dehydrogenase-like FAD/NAD-binding protein [Candidatus Omnitrophota bacterium]